MLLKDVYSEFDKQSSTEDTVSETWSDTLVNRVRSKLSAVDLKPVEISRVSDDMYG